MNHLYFKKCLCCNASSLHDHLLVYLNHLLEIEEIETIENLKRYIHESTEVSHEKNILQFSAYILMYHVGWTFVGM